MGKPDGDLYDQTPQWAWPDTDYLVPNPSALPRPDYSALLEAINRDTNNTEVDHGRTDMPR